MKLILAVAIGFCAGIFTIPICNLFHTSDFFAGSIFGSTYMIVYHSVLRSKFKIDWSK